VAGGARVFAASKSVRFAPPPRPRGGAPMGIWTNPQKLDKTVKTFEDYDDKFNYKVELT